MWERVRSDLLRAISTKGYIMNTARISLVLSVALLSSAAYCQDRFYEAGQQLGTELFTQEYSYEAPAIVSAPEWKEIFQGLATHEPSEAQFKQSFADLQMACKGIQASAANSSTLPAFIVGVLAGTVSDAGNIGQVFTQIGMQMKLFAHMPLNIPAPQPLNIITNDQAATHVLGKAYAQQIFAVLFEYAVAGTATGIHQAKATVVSLIEDHNPFTAERTMDQQASELFNVINGFEEGLQSVDLAQLKEVKPSKALLIRFVYELLSKAILVPGTIINGGKPDINGFADAFINCGQELEAIS